MLSAISLIIFLLGTLGLCISFLGLIKPAWLKWHNRKEALQAMGGAFIIIMFSLIIKPDPTPEEKLASQAQSTIEAKQQTEAQKEAEKQRNAELERLKEENEKLKTDLEAAHKTESQAKTDPTSIQPLIQSSETSVTQPLKSIEKTSNTENSAVTTQNEGTNLITGKVISVADGDTITILLADNTEQKVRLNQIDAPEKGQDFGKASKKSLSDLVYKKDVSIKKVDTDKYGRLVGTVFLDGKDINLEQVKNGMAWVYTEYATDQNYFDEEKKAKDSRSGLWDNPTAVAPWDFRHGVKKAQPKADETQTIAKLDASPSSSSDCGNKHFCKEMNSCAEAMHYLNDCGVYKLDRDNDGKPCESLCH